jgi:hypothetical protein
MNDDAHDRLLTRADVVEVIRNILGVPLTQSRLDKDTMSGLAPQPVAYYGRRQLYSRADALAYGKTLLTSAPVRLRGSRSGRLDELAGR